MIDTFQMVRLIIKEALRMIPGRPIGQYSPTIPTGAQMPVSALGFEDDKTYSNETYDPASAQELATYALKPIFDEVVIPAMIAAGRKAAQQIMNEVGLSGHLQLSGNYSFQLERPNLPTE